jgi:excinuclease ABC subunit C
MMREVLMRRLNRGLADENLPDLIVIDGGKGQLNVLLAVLSDLEIEGIDAVALAKSRVMGQAEGAGGAPLRSSERVFIPGVKDPVYLRSHTDELFLLTHLRDEAHRFAIEFHRQRRKKKNFRSALDEIPGVGADRRSALLRNFGSLRAVKRASVEELRDVKGVGPRLAQIIHDAFHETNPDTK